MKIRAFWGVAPCSLVGVDVFSEARTASIIRVIIMEALRTSETSVYSHETTQHYIPEGPNLHTRRRENLKSHK
jgi:hypothetical protein